MGRPGGGDLELSYQRLDYDSLEEIVRPPFVLFARVVDREGSRTLAEFEIPCGDGEQTASGETVPGQGGGRAERAGACNDLCELVAMNLPPRPCLHGLGTRA